MIFVVFRHRKENIPSTAHYKLRFYDVEFRLAKFPKCSIKVWLRNIGDYLSGLDEWENVGNKNITHFFGK